MAREHARVRLSIWEDADFRSLSPDAQHLYFVLMIHPTLSYCGVVDWRPARIAGFARGWTADRVELAAEELSAAMFLIVDESTEEVLLRSFVRSDGLMDQPNLAVAMRKAHVAVASSMIRGVVVHEVRRLAKEKPDTKGLSRVTDMLDWPSIDPSVCPSFRASVHPSPNPNLDEPKGSDNPSTDPSPTTNSLTPSPNSNSEKTSSSQERPRKRGTRIPDDWKPSQDDIAWQRNEGIPDDLARREHAQFVDYWLAESGAKAVKLDWSRAWKVWLRRTILREPALVGVPRRNWSEFD